MIAGFWEARPGGGSPPLGNCVYFRALSSEPYDAFTPSHSPFPPGAPKPLLDLSPPFLAAPAPGRSAGPSRATRAGPMRLACLAQLHTGQPKVPKTSRSPAKVEI